MSSNRDTATRTGVVGGSRDADTSTGQVSTAPEAGALEVAYLAVTREMLIDIN